MKLFLVLVAAFFITGCFGPPDVETRIQRYKSILADWEESGLVQHFPREIPANAKSPIFSAFPGFMQGGAWIQIRLQLPAEQIREICKEAERQAKQFHDGGSSTTLINRQEDGLGSTSFHTSGTDEREFPADYRIFIYDAVPYKKGSGFDWNHATTRGVAVSTKRSEVIYWAESW